MALPEKFEENANMTSKPQTAADYQAMIDAIDVTVGAPNERKAARQRIRRYTAKRDALAVVERAHAKRSGGRAKYTDNQLQIGFAYREQGNSWSDVAKTAGVKSPFHFSKALRTAFPSLAS